MLVKKQTVPHVKVPIFNFLELEPEGQGHYHRGPRSLLLQRPIHRKEIKVSSTVPNRVKPMYILQNVRYRIELRNGRRFNPSQKD